MFLGLWHLGKPKPLRFSSLRDKMNINKCNELLLKPFLCCLSLAANVCVCVCGGAASSCRLHGDSCSQCFHASSARRIQLGRRIQAPSVLQSSGFDVVDRWQIAATFPKRLQEEGTPSGEQQTHTLTLCGWLPQQHRQEGPLYEDPAVIYLTSPVKGSRNKDSSW